MTDARAKLAETVAARQPAGWATADGAYFGVGPVPGKLVVVFPGQGSQVVGMMRDVACLFPEMLGTLAAAGRDVVGKIYPPTDYGPDAPARQAAALTATTVAQPALGAVGLGVWRVLSERFGLTADAFAGHSYGELTALAAAGRVTEADFFRLSRKRGELMAAAAADAGGGMLAVLATPEAATTLVTAAGVDVVVANHNAPGQVVLAGPAAAVTAAEAAFRAAGVKCQRLPVAAAFHTRLVAGAAGPFRRFLDDIPMTAGTTAVYGNTTGDIYPADPAAAKDVLGGQLARPVGFVAEVRALLAAGVRTVVEAGPGRWSAGWSSRRPRPTGCR